METVRPAEEHFRGEQCPVRVRQASLTTLDAVGAYKNAADHRKVAPRPSRAALPQAVRYAVPEDVEPRPRTGGRGDIGHGLAVLCYPGGNSAGAAHGEHDVPLEWWGCGGHGVVGGEDCCTCGAMNASNIWHYDVNVVESSSTTYWSVLVFRKIPSERDRPTQNLVAG